MKFKTKPTFVEAQQFEKTKTPWPKGVEVVAGTNQPFLKTKNGNVNIKNGDWVVQTGDEHSLMQDGVFQQIYEKVGKEEK